jgi:hypothetical protein
MAVPDVRWLSASDAARVLRIAGFQWVLTGERVSGGIVLYQKPVTPDRAYRGTAVSLTLGKPQLTLTAGATAARIDDPITFNLRLEPPLPVGRVLPREIKVFDPTSVAPQFFYNWDGNQEQVTEASQSRRFSTPGSHSVSASVIVGNSRYLSDPSSISIEVSDYSARLEITASKGIRLQQPVKASIVLSPAADGHKVTYTFVWGDGRSDNATSPEFVHRYDIPGAHTIQGFATVDGREIHAGDQAIHVLQPPHYKIELDAPAKVAVNQQIEATATVTPRAGNVVYQFDWGDKTLPDSSNSPTGSHTYRTAGEYSITVSMMIAGEPYQSIAPITVAAPFPWGLLIALIVLAVLLAVVLTLISVRRHKPSPRAQSPVLAPQVQVHCSIGSVSHKIEHPEQIRNQPAVRIRSGIAYSAPMEPPPEVQKRSAGA